MRRLTVVNSKYTGSPSTASKLGVDDRLLVVGSDFYGSYWLRPGQVCLKARRPVVPSKKALAVTDGYDDVVLIDLPALRDSAGILMEVVLWLEEPGRTNKRLL